MKKNTKRIIVASVTLLLVGAVILGTSLIRGLMVPRYRSNPAMVARQIFLSMFNESFTGNWVWPAPSQYESSTEFFTTAVSNNWIKGVTYSFFQFDTRSSSEAELTPDANIWCLTEGLTTNSPLDTPCIFTKNITFSGNSIKTPMGIDSSLPFHLAIVGLKSGKVLVLQTNDLALFNQPGVDLPFLKP